MATKYMHTIDGRPALWNGLQIVFPASTSAVYTENSLNEIRRHQQATIRFRRNNDFDCDISRYGYVRVRESRD